VKFYREELKKYPALESLNWQMVRGLEYVEVETFPCNVRQKILEKNYTLPSNGVGLRLIGVKEFVPYIVNLFEDGQSVLHAFCGDGEYTLLLEEEAKRKGKEIKFLQHDEVDIRISKNKQLYSVPVKADWLVIRHVLHSPRDICFNFDKYNVVVVDFDVKYARVEVDHIHELKLCTCRGQIEYRFGPESMRGFDMRIRGATFGQFLCLRRRLIWDDG